MQTNRHPVDELSDVRAEMRRLRAREEQLRDLILGGECELIGDQFSASITINLQSKLDTDAVRKALSADQIKALSKPITIRTIKLSEREMVLDEG